MLIHATLQRWQEGAPHRASWRWDGVVVALILMFTGSMRPGEALSVTSSAVVLPSRWRRIVVVALWRHKSVTRGRAKGAHHVVFDEGLLVDVLEAHVQRLAVDALVVGLKPHAFRRKFDAILAELGLESLGLTPASLRAGGATERHLQREPIADISWLLRHADIAIRELLDLQRGARHVAVRTELLDGGAVDERTGHGGT